VTSWLARAARRFRAFANRDAFDNELDSEMRLHVALEADDIARATGVDANEARRRALVAFGGLARHREEHQDARGVRWAEEAGQDVRYAIRSLWRSAGFTMSSVLVLALGIGSTTAVFSAVDAVLLDHRYDRLAVILLRTYPSLSTVDYRAIEEQQRSFSAVGAIRRREVAFSAGGEPEPMRVAAATSGFFRAVGIRPVRGRAIEPGDEPVGAAPVAMVTHGLAERALGGDGAAVGRTVTLDGVAHTVVGVLPAGVSELAGARADVWPVLQLAQPTRRGPFGTVVVGRLKPGVTFDAATRDVAAISKRVAAMWSDGSEDRTAVFAAVPFRTVFVGDASRMLRVFAAGVGLVLLIAVANVASLMLVRAIGRAREVSLRTVLGATRTRLVRLFITESLVLAATGAGAGIALGALGLRALVVLGPRMPGLASAHLNVRAVAFAAVLALAIGVIVGAYPIALLLRGERPNGLGGGARTVGAGRQTHAARSAFVVAQFALALPLLAVAGLLLASFVKLQHVNPGFDPTNLLTVHVSLPSARYGNDTLVAAYWTRALPLVREVPGVREAGLGTSMPPNENGDSDDNFDLIDRPVPRGAAQPNSPWPSVTPEYFAALGVRLLEGRLFVPADTGDAAPVAIVSRSWARHYYPNEPVLGRKMIRGGCTTCASTVVVGVVDDIRYEGATGTGDAVYAPLTQGWSRGLNLFVRTAGDPNEVTSRVRAALRSLDPGVPLEDIAPMQDRLMASIAQPRHWATLLGGFAAAALVLASVGIFGMLSYTVSTRRREIGVRMALGARQAAVVGMIVRRGLAHAAAGTALGLVAALVATRSVGTVLFGVTPHDPRTLAEVTVALLVVALVASGLPARRAAAIDPVDAIRLE
jgi:predicted permease